MSAWTIEHAAPVPPVQRDVFSGTEEHMPQQHTGTIAGALSIDKNGERCFLVTRADSSAQFGARTVQGSHVLR